MGKFLILQFVITLFQLFLEVTFECLQIQIELLRELVQFVLIVPDNKFLFGFFLSLQGKQFLLLLRCHALLRFQ